MLPPHTLRKNGLSAALCLSDHVSCWCAWCTGYILRRSDLELHHVWNEGYLKRIFGARTFPLDCLVPVHENECHRRGLQFYADAAGHGLLSATQEPPAKIRDIARAAFFVGNLNQTLFLEECARRKYGTTSDELSFLLNAAAGSALAKQLLNMTDDQGLSWLDITKVRRDPEWLLYSGSVLLNSGEIGGAVTRFKEAEHDVPRWRRTTSRLFGVHLRRMAIVGNSPSAAFKTVEIAQSERFPYTVRTALASLGWAHFRESHYVQARDKFEEIRDHEPHGTISWWHEAQLHFGSGCAQYWTDGVSGLRGSLTKLLKAQYIFALLGLQGIPVPDPRHQPHSPLTSLTPTDMIVFLGERHAKTMTRSYMTELRRHVLLDSRLREQLLDTLANRSG